MKKIFIILFSSLFVSTLVVLPCYAGSPLSPDLQVSIKAQAGESGLNSGKVFNADVSLTQIVAQVIQVFLSLLGIIFVVLMILGGYNWMTAQGDESKVEKAKSTIQKAVIGLIIIVASYSITYTVFKAINF